MGQYFVFAEPIKTLVPTKAKLLIKIPMQQIVIDITGQIWRYFFTAKGVKYAYMGSTSILYI